MEYVGRIMAQRLNDKCMLRERVKHAEIKQEDLLGNEWCTTIRLEGDVLDLKVKLEEVEHHLVPLGNEEFFNV